MSGVTLGGGLYMILGFEHINKKFAPTFDDAKKRLQKIIESRYTKTIKPDEQR